MKLGEILQGDFFGEYVKPGNVMMLSNGNVQSDDVFSLSGGLLKLYLGKETYERAGLVGKPHGAKGHRGLKTRWSMNCDL